MANNELFAGETPFQSWGVRVSKTGSPYYIMRCEPSIVVLVDNRPDAEQKARQRVTEYFSDLGTILLTCHTRLRAYCEQPLLAMDSRLHNMYISLGVQKAPFYSELVMRYVVAHIIGNVRSGLDTSDVVVDARLNLDDETRRIYGNFVRGILLNTKIETRQLVLASATQVGTLGRICKTMQEIELELEKLIAEHKAKQVR